jgi:sodium pump decarboxylase gamma subunit
MESLETGFVLMAAGMGTVAVLLTTLVFVVRAVSAFSRWLAPAAALPQPFQPAITQTADSELIGVIGAAIATFRRHSGD